MEEKIKANIFSEWLEKLQQESWQLELLISGFALFGIWESRDMVGQAGQYIGVNAPASGGADDIMKIFILMLLAAWTIFFINLLFHVILRGLWIGAIGLRYVSGDIDYDSLDYSEEFNKYFKKRVGQFDDYIERLEKVCSVIFAYTFLLFFIFLSFAMFIAISILLTNVLDQIFTEHDYIVDIVLLTYSILGFLVFLDFITLGALKKVRNKSFAKYYSYLYRFFSFITLSFIYRPLLYNFIDYKYTRRLFWFSLPYVLGITIILPNFFLEGTPHFPSLDYKDSEYESFSKHIVSKNLYDDERNLDGEIGISSNYQIRFISLASREFTGSHGQLFLRQKSSDEKLLTYKYGITPYRNSGLNHRMFGNSHTDSLIQKIERQKTKAVLKAIRTRKAERAALGQVDTIKGETNPFLAGMNHGQYGDKTTDQKDYWDMHIDSVRTYWKNKIKIAEEDKFNNIKKALMDANQISIDGRSINHELSCKFYKHPNLNEKGLLCYFPIDSLELGEHTLRLDRSLYDKNFKDSINHTIFNIPFWKIIKN